MKKYRPQKTTAILIIVLVTLSFFSCKKTTTGGNNNSDTTTIVAKKCDLQHHCPTGYICDSGYCKKAMTGCNCIRPVPPGCAALCGP